MIEVVAQARDSVVSWGVSGIHCTILSLHMKACLFRESSRAYLSVSVMSCLCLKSIHWKIMSKDRSLTRSSQHWLPKEKRMGESKWMIFLLQRSGTICSTRPALVLLLGQLWRACWEVRQSVWGGSFPALWGHLEMKLKQICRNPSYLGCVKRLLWICSGKHKMTNLFQWLHYVHCLWSVVSLDDLLEL